MSDFIIPNNITLPTFMNFDFQRCGHKVIDEFISYTHSKKYGKMEFVPYNKFKDITFIHEGGFSKIYKATWNEGPRDWRAPSPYRSGKMTVALKELNDSYNINSGELEELYNYSIKSISEAGYAYYDHFNYIIKRPTASNLLSKVKTMLENEINRKNPTKIIESSDIGPVITNNPGAIYKSRPLSEMIKSAIYIINLRSLTIISKIDKRKFDDLIKDNYENDNSKKIKSCESENNDYLMELDIGIETNTSISNNNYYITKEICNFF
ncbi:unnamed protein product [Rhizophagus irregularis]|nr:unnamed protein product [Rhizophagus irregularis]